MKAPASITDQIAADIAAFAERNFREQFAESVPPSASSPAATSLRAGEAQAAGADPHIVSVVYGDGNQLYLRCGELTDDYKRATVWADEELADAEATRFAALKKPNWVVIFIGAVSLQKIEDGPSDRELGYE